MKAASTYVARVLARYLGTEVPEVEYDWLAEQNLTEGLRRQLAGRPFVISLHMRPHASNLSSLTADDIRVSLLWRNLGDVIASFDDHVPRYGAHNPMFFVDHDGFIGLPRQERYRHAIDGLIPWNLGFYLHWSCLPGLVFNPYEYMVQQREPFFQQVLSQLGIAVDLDWLAHVLASPVEGARLNVGRSGRSDALLDATSKRRIERYVIEHPQFDALEVLLWELPWKPVELSPVSPYDGRLVRGDSGRQYFVSRGVRHEVSTRWRASRGVAALRSGLPIAAEALDAIPEGPSIF